MLEEEQSLGERTALTVDISALLYLCLKSTYFRFAGKFHEQREGAAIGSPVSAVIGKLYMEYFKQRVVENTPQRFRLWKSYADNTCCIADRGSVDVLLDHLNSIQLSFWDTCVRRKDDGSLDITVYRKPTHTDRYPCYSSHHPQYVKRGLVRCLFNRAKGITLEPRNRRQEKRHLTRVLKTIGYPGAFVRSAPTLSRIQGGGKGTHSNDDHPLHHGCQ